MPRRVFSGPAHAVIGGDADHVDLVDVVLSEPVGQRGATLVEPAEPAVTGVVGTLAKDGLEPAGVEIGMEFRAGGIGKAVRRP